MSKGPQGPSDLREINTFHDTGDPAGRRPAGSPLGLSVHAVLTVSNLDLPAIVARTAVTAKSPNVLDMVGVSLNYMVPGPNVPKIELYTR